MINTTFDPMIILVQLGILGFKPIHTKISFQTNSLVIQPYGWSQTISRTVTFSSHNDVDKLKPIIQNAIKYYRPSKNEAIQRIFAFALKGLRQLKNTYEKEETANTPDTLQNFITLIKVNLPEIEKVEEEKKKNNNKLQPQTNLQELIVKEAEESDIGQGWKKVIALWNQSAYSKVLSYFDAAANKQGDTSVDISQKGEEEMKVLEAYVAYKVAELNYALATESFS
jgi:hypothetical protein